MNNLLGFGVEGSGSSVEDLLRGWGLELGIWG